MRNVLSPLFWRQLHVILHSERRKLWNKCAHLKIHSLISEKEKAVTFLFWRQTFDFLLVINTITIRLTTILTWHRSYHQVYQHSLCLCLWFRLGVWFWLCLWFWLYVYGLTVLLSPNIGHITRRANEVFVIVIVFVFVCVFDFDLCLYVMFDLICYHLTLVISPGVPTKPPQAPATAAIPKRLEVGDDIGQKSIYFCKLLKQKVDFGQISISVSKLLWRWCVEIWVRYKKEEVKYLFLTWWMVSALH